MDNNGERGWKWEGGGEGWGLGWGGGKGRELYLKNKKIRKKINTKKMHSGVQRFGEGMNELGKNGICLKQCKYSM